MERKCPCIFFQWGFDEGGDINSTLSLAQPPATYRDGEHRTPRYKGIMYIHISLLR